MTNLILFYCILYFIVYHVGFTVISKWLLFCMELTVTGSFLVFSEVGIEVLNICVSYMLQDVTEVYTINQLHQS
jgi:hypothetical protein